jgi:pimeloyl-ACP methyl ester carboxylesterase
MRTDMTRRRWLIASTGLAATALLSGAARAHGFDAEDDADAAERWTRERRFQTTPYGRTAYIDRGTGPTALFLHGFPLSGFQWRGAIDRLSKIRRCLAPDSMGLGFTEVLPGRSVTPDDQVKMLIAFLDALSVDAVDLVANDSGGAVAQLLAIRYPQRVRSLLLTNCDVEPDSPPPALKPVFELAEMGIWPDAWLAPWLKDKAKCRAPDGLGGMCFSNPEHPTDAAIEQYLGPILQSVERKDLANRYALGLKPNPLAGIEGDLRKLDIPVRVVWGMSDGIFSKDNPDYLARILPRVEAVRRIPEAKLFFPEEYPHIIAEEARRLWKVA